MLKYSLIIRFFLLTINDAFKNILDWEKDSHLEEQENVNDQEEKDQENKNLNEY